MQEETEKMDQGPSGAGQDLWIRLDKAKVVLSESHSRTWWNQLCFAFAMIFFGVWFQSILEGKHRWLFLAIFLVLFLAYLLLVLFLVIPRGKGNLENQAKCYPERIEQANIVMENITGFLKGPSGAKLSEAGFNIDFVMEDLKINVSSRGATRNS